MLYLLYTKFYFYIIHQSVVYLFVYLFKKNLSCLWKNFSSQRNSDLLYRLKTWKCMFICLLPPRTSTNEPKRWISRTYQKILFSLIFVLLKIFSHLFTSKMFCCREDSLITPKGIFVVHKWHLWFLWSNWNFQVILYPPQFLRIGWEIQVISRWWVFRAELSLCSPSLAEALLQAGDCQGKKGKAYIFINVF